MYKPVLIVDAARFICDVLQNILQRKLGIPTMATVDIQQGAAWLKDHEHSFALLGADWQGPELRQAVDYLRAQRPGPWPLIIMVSDKEPQPDALLTASGANGYIFKPFTEAEISQWIRSNAASLLGAPWQDGGGPTEGPASATRPPADTARVEELMLAINSVDFATKAKAVVELGRMRAPEAVERLIELLYAEDEIKVYVVTALGNIRDVRAVPPLIALLNYKDPQVQEAVVEAVAKIGDPKVVRPLARCLKVPDKNMVLLAIKALGMLGNREAIPALEDMLAVSDEQVRANAQWALRKIDGMDS